MEAMTLEQCEELNLPWRPVVPLRGLKNQPIVPLRGLKNQKMSEATRTESAANKISDDNLSSYHSRKIQRGTFDTPFPNFICFEGTGHENERHTMQKMSYERRKERGANKISAIAEQTDDNFSSHHSRKIQRGTFDTPFPNFICFEGTGHENERHTMQKMSDERRKERGANKISANSEQTDVNFPDNSSKFKKGTFVLCCQFTFVLCSQFLPCAGGNDLGDSHQKQQTVNGIYQHTLRNVSHCPSVSDYIQRARDKCAEVCTNNIQDDGCSYHCMRDSYKTSLVEFCAKPKLLFDYCPEYDSIGQTVQKDIYTPCKPFNPFERLYNSSDLFFCDQDKCLQLRDASVSTSVTSLMTDRTPVSGDLNESWLSQYWFRFFLFGLAVILFIVLAIGGIFRLRGRLVANSRKYTKRGNPNHVQDENEQAALHNTA